MAQTPLGPPALSTFVAPPGVLSRSKGRFLILVLIGLCLVVVGASLLRVHLAEQRYQDLENQAGHLKSALEQATEINELAHENGFYMGLYAACVARVSDPENCLPGLAEAYGNHLYQWVQDSKLLAGWHWPPSSYTAQ